MVPFDVVSGAHHGLLVVTSRFTADFSAVYRPGFLKHDSPVHDSPVVIRLRGYHKAYSGTLSRREITRVNASYGEIRRDKEKLSLPISCELRRVKAS